LQIDFYHLTHAPVERVLPRIAERVLEENGRLLIVSGDTDLAERLDAQLWNYRPDSFLPHGRCGEPDDNHQPVLIAPNCEALNGARNLALADGIWREEAREFDRTFFLFGEDRVDEARAAWRTLSKQDGVECRFWKQNEAGKWSRER